MEDSSLPDTIEQVDNQTCKARTRVTMQRLLHGLGTQVPGHVQVASPQAPFFPKVPICSHGNTYSANAVKIRISFKNATKISHASIALFKNFDR